MGRLLRRIAIDGTIFLWYLRYERLQPAYALRLRVFVRNDKTGVLEIDFLSESGASVGDGYPEFGVISWPDQEQTYNLNRPAVIAALIRYALKEGWRSSGSHQSFHWKNGVELLTLASAPQDSSTIDPNLGRLWQPR